MKGFIPIIVFIGSLFTIAGCKTIEGGQIYEPLKTGMESDIVKMDSNYPRNGEMEPTGTITIDEALDAARKMHPGLAAARYNIEAYNGVIKQAGTLPNPTLFGEIEEFGGSGDYNGTGVMSSGIGISQEIPIAGQPSRRVKVARIQKSIAESEFSARTVALRTEVKKRFLRVYVLQEQLKLEEENLNILRSMKEAVLKRVLAGEASSLDEVKVAVLLKSAEIAFERADQELESARYKLASSWGKELPRFEQVEYVFDEDITIPDEKNLIDRAKYSPTYSILEKNVILASSSLDLARAEAWMDIEVGAGIQRFNETDDHAYFLEISIPLPIFNRNSGNIVEAINRHNMAQKEFEAGTLELRTELRELTKLARSVQGAFLTMRKMVIPAAEKAFESVKKAYEAGEEGYLELLEAQRTQLETRREQLELFNEMHELKIEIDALAAEDDRGR